MAARQTEAPPVVTQETPTDAPTLLGEIQNATHDTKPRAKRVPSALFVQKAARVTTTTAGKNQENCYDFLSCSSEEERETTAKGRRSCILSLYKKELI